MQEHNSEVDGTVDELFFFLLHYECTLIYF